MRFRSSCKTSLRGIGSPSRLPMHYPTVLHTSKNDGTQTWLNASKRGTAPATYASAHRQFVILTTPVSSTGAEVLSLSERESNPRPSAQWATGVSRPATTTLSGSPLQLAES